MNVCTTFDLIVCYIIQRNPGFRFLSSHYIGTLRNSPTSQNKSNTACARLSSFERLLGDARVDHTIVEVVKSRVRVTSPDPA